MRPIAFVDLETSGLDPTRHEILEIGVVRVDGRSLETLGMFDVRVQPKRIEDADPEALRINRWTQEAWSDAVPLDVALVRTKPLVEGALLAGHNVSFDRSFLDAAWRSTGVPAPPMDHHVLDTAALSWPLLVAGLVDSLSLDPVCRHLAIECAEPHHALTDARRSLEVARRLLLETEVVQQVRSMEADERAIANLIVDRIDAGRKDYGPWRTSDGRDYPGEALLEVVDALNYCAAELVRMRRPR